MAETYRQKAEERDQLQLLAETYRQKAEAFELTLQRSKADLGAALLEVGDKERQLAEAQHEGAGGLNELQVQTSPTLPTCTEKIPLRKDGRVRMSFVPAGPTAVSLLECFEPKTHHGAKARIA